MHRLFHDSLLFRPMMLPDKFHKLFLAHLLRGGAMQMTGLFIPVFLFLNATSYPLKQVIAPFNGSPLIAGLGTVCLFFLGVRVLTTLLALPAGKSMQKIGLIKSMFLGNVALVGVQLSLWFSLQNPWLIFVAMLCAALEALYYWTPYLTEFSAFADEKVLSNEVGFLEFSNRTVRAILPMVGGVLIGLVGFDGLFATASAFIVFSVVLLFFAPEVRLSGQPSFGEFRRWLKHPEYRKIAVGLAGRLWEDNGLALWPIYLFLFIGSAERVGYVYTLALLASLIITYFIGSAIHRAGERRSLMASATVLSLVWAVRSFAGQFWHFLTVDIAHRLIDSIYIPSFDVFLFRQSRHQKMFEFFIYRELLISIGSVVFWSLALSLFVLGIAWNGIFFLAGLGVFASMWLSISKMRSDEYRIS